MHCFHNNIQSVIGISLSAGKYFMVLHFAIYCNWWEHSLYKSIKSENECHKYCSTVLQDVIKGNTSTVLYSSFHMKWLNLTFNTKYTLYIFKHAHTFFTYFFVVCSLPFVTYSKNRLFPLFSEKKTPKNRKFIWRSLISAFRFQNKHKSKI